MRILYYYPITSILFNYFNKIYRIKNNLLNCYKVHHIIIVNQLFFNRPNFINLLLIF